MKVRLADSTVVINKKICYYMCSSQRLEFPHESNHLEVNSPFAVDEHSPASLSHDIKCFPRASPTLPVPFLSPFGAEPLAASREPIPERKSPEATLRLGSRAEAVLSEVEFETLKIWV